MRLYLCGPVSLGGACTPEQVKANIQRLYDAETILKSAGYTVESPAKILEFCDQTMVAVMLPDDGTCPSGGVERWQWYMRRTVLQMLTCDAVATLKGVEQSRGCIKEMNIASDFGMQMKSVAEWLRVAAVGQ